MTITKPTVTNSFTANTLAKASEVNANFTDLLNEFEDNGYIAKGWIAIDNASFEYQASNAIKTTTDVDVTGLIQVGDKITFEQATDGEKFFFITAIDYNSTVANRTYIELYGGTDYDVDNEAITADTVGFSRVKAPFGFPLDPDKWSVTQRRSANDQTSSFSGSSGTVRQIDNLTSMQVPIGVWNAEFIGAIVIQDASIHNMFYQVSLSESATSELNKILGSGIAYGDSPAGDIRVVPFCSLDKITLTSTKTYYPVMRKGTGDSADLAGLRGDYQETIIRFTIAYL